MNVIYNIPWQSKNAVVSAAVQEDPDVMGFNAYSEDHLIVPKVLDPLSDYGLLEDTIVLIGGNIPVDHHEALR